MYNLTKDRRKRERRLLCKVPPKPVNLPADVIIPERRASDRRCDIRPMSEFPYLPQSMI